MLPRLVRAAPRPQLAGGALRCFRSDAPPAATSGEEHIRNKLQQALRPTKLAVTDTSGGCGSMYVVEIEAECFRGLSRVKQTKMVNGLLKGEIAGMHGMRVLCSVPPDNE